MNPPLLEFKKTSLKLKGASQSILSSISYGVNENDFVIILGSNGSGKSSLLKLIDKRYQASSGEIWINGQALEKYASKTFHRSVKTLTQNCPESLFEGLTVLENYLLVKQQEDSKLFVISTKKEREYFGEYVKAFNANLPSKLDQIVDQLSGGEKQALALALTILYPPRILLLDEHTSALDPKSAGNIMALTKKMVQKYKITCLLTTHNLSEAAQYGNRILVLKEGKIHKTIESAEKENLREAELLTMCY
jgi:putative ABC transport system ATP-binding protein